MLQAEQKETNMQIQKLQKLEELQKKKTYQNNLTRFENLVVINVAVEPRLHFPKIFDENGRKTDERSAKSDGYIYTFSEFSTAKIVKIVLANRVNLSLLNAYKIGGNGYSIKNANMIFIEKNGTIEEY